MRGMSILREDELHERESYIPPCSVCPNFRIEDDICFNGKSFEECPAYKLSEKLNDDKEIFLRILKQWIRKNYNIEKHKKFTQKEQIVGEIFKLIVELEGG